MQDPIGSFLRIRELYLSYLDTAFRIADPSVANERRRLLRTPGTGLCTDPLIEPLPTYRPASLKLHDLIRTDLPTEDDPLDGFGADERRAFVDLLLAGLFPSSCWEGGPLLRKADHAPYTHQLDMLRLGVRPGTPGIVTSGTGSGKTEAFFLPVLAALAREARRWPAPEERFLGEKWWCRPPSYATDANPLRTPWSPQRAREHPDRPKAVRALILYPMNALVEDQLVRLRKALDSAQAHAAMNRHFAGNHIFFGRYTSKSPVTGHADHPGLRPILEMARNDPRIGDRIYGPEHGRADDSGMVGKDDIRAGETSRRRRKQQELREAMRDAEAVQRAARIHARGGNETAGDLPASASDDDTPFLFPTVDGSEMVSRWDMQETPPDILITNTSMLSAMLAREVDAPIFERTRAWLESDPDAYFYLVLDELHLQRGSAGTEVAYLLRLLLSRLGLDRAEHANKLRILASSASLPAHPRAEAERSAGYLWDMFGPFGLGDLSINEAAGRERWLASIVPGQEQDSEAGRTGLLRAEPFLELLAFEKDVAAAARTDDPILLASSPDEHPEIEPLWRAVAGELGVGGNNLAQIVQRSVAAMGDRLAAVCFDKVEKRSRARSVDWIAERLLADPVERGDDTLDAMRAMLFVRGCGDGLRDYFKRHTTERLGPPSFRTHLFFRSIEGLYAAPFAELYHPPEGEPERAAPVGPLDIEHTSRALPDLEGMEDSVRLLELLYCEACGDLFFGGMRPECNGDRPPGIFEEVLPHEPILDGLPDTASSQRFEELSWSRYVLFWPSEAEPIPFDRGGDPHKWEEAILARHSGLVHKPPDPRGQSAKVNGIAGFLYFRPRSPLDKHKRGQDDPETHVPYACPKCGTDYLGRHQGRGWLSPIRNFRAGFGKTTQLLATELFDVQRVSEAAHAPKLVSFSDSRQDAARAALDIESNHHQDLRRELLLLSASRNLTERRGRDEVTSDLRDVEAEIDGAVAAKEYARMADLGARQQILAREQATLDEPSVALSDIVDDPGDSLLPLEGREVSWAIADMVRQGIHPYDDAGVALTKGSSSGGSDTRFEWDHLFEVGEKGTVQWRDTEIGSALHNARSTLVTKFLKATTDVVFSKNYFSIEETGLAHATVALTRLPEARRTPKRVQELAALLRVLTDAYRYTPSPYRSDNDPLDPWVDPGHIQNRRIQDFAKAVWGDQYQRELALALADLGETGHPNGIVRLLDTRLCLAAREDPFWRCEGCARIHLHRGLGRCTRCHVMLSEVPAGHVEKLWNDSFLGRRVLRAQTHERSQSNVNGTFRLHCEELTGQTDDPAERQRAFRGIFLGDTNEAKETVDLLAVTTTMEVGIDIGPLQAVLQANMPPQRFNYQQRVGRAGRRGQAFSLALTICRTRSHDIHYFREPERVTGDVPPVPFLTKGMGAIAARLLRKSWLVAAFDLLRREDRANGRIFPADLVPAPDIHGEFLWAQRYRGSDENWHKRLRGALEATRAKAEATARLLELGGQLEPLVVNVTQLLGEIGAALDVEGSISDWLAQTLAELGMLPMYGMPTRTRNLYLELRLGEGCRPETSTINRDLDIAIYEFAPGRIVVKDKHEHLAVGFTADFHLPAGGAPAAQRDAQMFGPLFGERFEMKRCPTCGAWDRNPETGDPSEECRSCGATLQGTEAVLCVVPNGFRTDFHPRPKKDTKLATSRHRSVQAEGKPLDFTDCTYDAGGQSVRMETFLDDEARTYQLNRGPPLADESQTGFTAVHGSQTVRAYASGRSDPTPFVSFRLGQQAVEQELVSTIRGFEAMPNPVVAWLASPKTTDSLFLAPTSIRSGLALGRLPSRSEGGVERGAFRWQGVRAAALSASYLVAYSAALDLDIDPEEFDILEPRLYGADQPILQIADKLINGAGFCRYLAEEEGSAPRIARLVHEMLFESDGYPLEHFDAPEHGECDAACYRCLLRYGNQYFHGLLDWRLALTYLRAATDPDFACGLDSDFDAPGLAMWPEEALRLAGGMAGLFGSDEAPRLLAGAIPAVELELDGSRFDLLLAHPLWNWGQGHAVGGALLEAYRELEAEGREVQCWDTFNLSRRAIQVREAIRRDRA